MNGVAITTSSDVVKFAQTSSGMRQKVIPGARMVMIVTRKLSAVMIEDAPAHWTPMLKNTVPSGWLVESGAYPVQPAANAPPGTRKLSSIIVPGDRQQPERQRVQARERHVRRADHQRDHVVAEAGERRDHEQEDHQRGVHRDEAVEGLVVDELHARPRELGAEEHRHHPAGDEEDDRRDEVLDPDHLVVGVRAEVVRPGLAAVARVVLGHGRRADRVPRPSSRSSRARRGSRSAPRSASRRP